VRSGKEVDTIEVGENRALVSQVQLRKGAKVEAEAPIDSGVKIQCQAKEEAERVVHVSILLQGDVLIVAQCLQLSVTLTSYELTDARTKTVSRGPQGETERSGGLALAVSCVDLDVAPREPFPFHS
jgi:hypothetical protein